MGNKYTPKGWGFRTWKLGEKLRLWSPDPVRYEGSSEPSCAGTRGSALGSWSPGAQTLVCRHIWVWTGPTRLVLGVWKEAENWTCCCNHDKGYYSGNSDRNNKQNQEDESSFFLPPVFSSSHFARTYQGKRLVPGQHHITVVRMFGCFFFFFGGGCYFVVAEKQ